MKTKIPQIMKIFSFGMMAFGIFAIAITLAGYQFRLVDPLNSIDYKYAILIFLAFIALGMSVIFTKKIGVFLVFLIFLFLSLFSSYGLMNGALNQGLSYEFFQNIIPIVMLIVFLVIHRKLMFGKNLKKIILIILTIVIFGIIEIFILKITDPGVYEKYSNADFFTYSEFIVGYTVMLIISTLLMSSLKQLIILRKTKKGDESFLTSKKQYKGVFISLGIFLIAMGVYFFVVFNKPLKLQNVDESYFQISGYDYNLADADNDYIKLKEVTDELNDNTNKACNEAKKEDKNHVCGELYNMSLSTGFCTQEISEEAQRCSFGSAISENVSPDMTYSQIKKDYNKGKEGFEEFIKIYPQLKEIALSDKKFEYVFGNGYEGLINTPYYILPTFRAGQVYVFMQCQIKKYDECTDSMITMLKLGNKYINSKGIILNTEIGNLLYNMNLKTAEYIIDNFDLGEDNKQKIKQEIMKDIDFDEIIKNIQKKEYDFVKKSIEITDKSLEKNLAWDKQETQLLAKNIYKDILDGKYESLSHYFNNPSLYMDSSENLYILTNKNYEGRKLIQSLIHPNEDGTGINKRLKETQSKAQEIISK